jgi:hypothetical protein
MVVLTLNARGKMKQAYRVEFTKKGNTSSKGATTVMANSAAEAEQIYQKGHPNDVVLSVTAK